METQSLIRKYNVPAPRYTSYPTVPMWDTEKPDLNTWKKKVAGAFSHSNAKEGISLYVHLPFCESLCTYCGCNTRITVNHAVEEPYIQTLLKEWKLYSALFSEKPRLREIHFGGGTPTFFHPDQLKTLLEGLFADAEIPLKHDFGFEAHPNSTSGEHLETLHSLGFNRVSFGVQDFDPFVQEKIHRIQPFETVKNGIETARKVGYDSVNFDLIYGLPFQSKDSIRLTMKHTDELRPDRIAFYSYAHVPWIKPGQRKFTEKDLPAGDEKRALYEMGREELEKMGYVEIGMDHFALKSDSLYHAFQNRSLHRNFMGYTPMKTDLLLGLGTSSISDSWTAFAQNRKTVEEYTASVEAGELPIFKGHILSETDQLIRSKILDLMCRMRTSLNDFPGIESVMERLGPILKDGLVEYENELLIVTEKGRPFLRNICMTLDLRLWEKEPGAKVFSMAV